MVVPLTDTVNQLIKLTKLSVGVVNWGSMGSEGDFHGCSIPFNLKLRLNIAVFNKVQLNDAIDRGSSGSNIESGIHVQIRIPTEIGFPGRWVIECNL